MTFNPRDSLLWVFCWASTKAMPRRDYPTAIVAFTRKELIRSVEQHMNEPWKRTYRSGGRAIRCALKPH